MADFIWIKDETKDKVLVRLSNGSNYERPNWTLWMEQGTLANGTPIDESESLIGCTFFGDVDGNAYKDLIIGLLGGSNVYLNTGTEFIKENSSTWFEDGSFAYCQQDYFGDIDGDGKDDLLNEFKFNIDGSTSADESYLMVHRSNGQEFLPTEFHWEGTEESRYDNTHIHSYGDFNGDGLTDLYFSGSRVKLSLGDRFTDYQDWSDLSNGFEVSHVADVTGDGKDDIVGWNQTGIFVRPVDYKSPTIAGPTQFCSGDEVTYELQGVNSNALINWSYPSSNMYIISGQGTSTIKFGVFSPGINKTVQVNVQYDGRVFEDTQLISKIYYSGDILATPTIKVSTDNPSNLVCCGRQTFRHASLDTYKTNQVIEWKPIIYSADAQDFYGFNTETKDLVVTAIKNTYNPLILGAKARLLSPCGVPSEWSNEISRYYGTISSNVYSYSSVSTPSSLENISQYAPIREVYSNRDLNLHIEFLDVLHWLEIKYSGINLTPDDISRIQYFLLTRYEKPTLRIDVFDLNRRRLLTKSVVKNSKINLSHLISGAYVVSYQYLDESFERKIIVQ